MTNEMRLIEALKDCITAMKHGDPNEPTTSIAWSKTIENAESVLASKPEQDTLTSPLPDDNGWIRVEDGLPDKLEECFVWYVGTMCKPHIRTATYLDNGHFSTSGIQEGNWKVTHWHKKLGPPPVEQKLNQ